MTNLNPKAYEDDLKKREQNRDYSIYSASALLESYQILKIVHENMSVLSKNRPIIQACLTAISDELETRMIPK